MAHLTQVQQSELKALLEDKLSKLIDYRQSVVEESPVQDPDRLGNSEEGEESMEAYEMLESESLENETTIMIQDIRDALERMKNGSYGLDQETGEPIPYLRLKLFPEARTNAKSE